MGTFLQVTTALIAQHGLALDYTQHVTGTYDVALGSAPITSTTTALTMYPRQIEATTYNYPDLIGKELVMFYLAAGAGVTPKLNDTISYKSKTFKVSKIKEHMVDGAVVLYKIIAAAS